jgi:hypothetical protein
VNSYLLSRIPSYGHFWPCSPVYKGLEIWVEYSPTKSKKPLSASSTIHSILNSNIMMFSKSIVVLATTALAMAAPARRDADTATCTYTLTPSGAVNQPLQSEFNYSEVLVECI